MIVFYNLNEKLNSSCVRTPLVQNRNLVFHLSIVFYIAKDITEILQDN